MCRWIYSLIISSFLLPSMAFCFGGAQVGLFTPWSFVDQKLQQFFSSSSVQGIQQLGDFDVTFDPLTWHISQAQVQASARYQSGPLTPQSYDLATTNMNIVLTVQKMSVDQVIQKIINGTIVNIHVQATCGPFTLSQPAAEVYGQLGFQIAGSEVQTKINRFDVSWAPGSWSISDVPCTGPSGFDVTLKEQLIEQLKSGDTVQSFIPQALSEEIQRQVGAVLTELAKPHALPVSQSATPLTLDLQSLQASDAGILAIGDLVWSGNPDETDIRPLPVEAMPSAITESTAPVVISETATWNDLIQAQLKAGPPLIEIHLNQIKSFQRILDCRLLQLFLWPDLFHFKKYSRFDLEIQNPKGLGLQWQNNGSAILDVAASGWIESIRAGKLWKYLEMQGKFHGSATPQVTDGRLHLQINSTQSSIAVQFDRDYVKAFSPNQHLSASIQKNIKGYLASGISYDTDLPQFDLGPFGFARFNRWNSVAPGWIGIPLSVRK